MRRERDPVDLLQLLDPTLHLRRLIGLVSEPADKSFDTGDLFILLPLGLFERGNPFIPCPDIFTVISRVLGQVTIPDFDDPGDHLIEKKPIV